MSGKEETMREMDDAAKLAGEEFEKHCDEWTCKDVVKWWASWYLKAGHKRLGRILVARSKREQ